VAATVDIRRIEKVDAQLDGALNRPYRLTIVDYAPTDRLTIFPERSADCPAS
jgi:hypothetical protein